MISLKQYIFEKLVINKHLDDQTINPHNLKLDDVPDEYKDIDNESLNNLDNVFKKKCYKKDGKPTNWFLWWMMLCVFGPMTRKEALKNSGFPEGSYTTTWTEMSIANIIMYDTKLRKNIPMPMSKWRCKIYK